MPAAAAFPLHQGITDGENNTSNHAHRQERHQRHHHGEASFSSQAEPEPPPLLVPCPRRLYLPLPGSHEPCRAASRSPSPHLRSRNDMVMSKRERGKIMDTSKQLCAS
jgi:hypothetical protein